MSFSKPNYKDFSFAHHGAVYRILEKLFAELNISYYLIGANARDVQLYKNGIKPSRGTADIDFAIMVPDFVVYNTIFDSLCNLGFRRPQEQYRLMFDLILIYFKIRATISKYYSGSSLQYFRALITS